MDSALICTVAFHTTAIANIRTITIITQFSTMSSIKVLGNRVQISRGLDGRLPCPCGAEIHSRYNFQKLHNLLRRTNHPGPYESTNEDIPFQIHAPSPPSNDLNPNSDPYTTSSIRESLSNENLLGQIENEDTMDVDIPGENDAPQEIVESIPDLDIADGQDDSDGEDEMVLTDDVSLSMPADHSPDAYSNPESFLLRYGIRVEPAYRLVVCLECQEILHSQSIYNHKVIKHYRNTKNLPINTRLPLSADILAAIEKLGGRDIEPPEPSSGPIKRISGVKVVSGKKCTFRDCTGHIYASRSPMLKHQSKHAGAKSLAHSTTPVLCQPLNLVKEFRRYIEVTPVVEQPGDASLDLLLQAAEDCNLLKLDNTFRQAISEQEKSAVFSQTRWDHLLNNVNIEQLLLLSAQSGLFSQPRFSLLRTLVEEYYQSIVPKLVQIPVLVRRQLLTADSSRPLKNQPFRRPQQLGTVSRDADCITHFLSFLIVHHESPINEYPIVLHENCLDENKLPKPEFLVSIHQTVWAILSETSREFLNNDEFCPFTRFLIAAHLKKHGQIERAHAITPFIARAQWAFRATASQQLIVVKDQYGGNFEDAFVFVRKFVSEGSQTLFNSLRQTLHLLSALAYRQQGMARFIWSRDRRTLSIDGFPVHIPTFLNNVRQTLVDVTKQIKELFRGFDMDSILVHIDQSMVPDESGQSKWFIDQISNDDERYSFINEDRNGLNSGHRLFLQFLLDYSGLFHRDGNQLVANRKKVNQWFEELGTVVRGLYYLVVTTWGGGARGTETEKLLFANRHSRNLLLINGLLTIITEYSKTQSMTGAGHIIARAPAFQVSRLLVLLISTLYPAAGYINCFIGADKLHCLPYFYEIFVLHGNSMTTKDFTRTLGEFNQANAGLDLKLADFRQFMSCVLISSTHCSFTDPDEEDENVRAAHESFNHSVETGRQMYGVDDVGKRTRIAPDALARMQQVSLRWHAFIGLLHPILLEKIPVNASIEQSFNSAETTALIETHFRSFQGFVQGQLEGYEVRTQQVLVRLFESLSTQLLERINPNGEAPSYSNPHRIPVPPQLLTILRQTFGRMFTTFKSPEQAELINSSRSNLHVIGVLATGGGKSMSFFGAAKIYPHSLFIVISPLIALTHDHEAHRISLSIKGGIWGNTNLDPHEAQIVFVSAHLATTEAFIDWASSVAIQKRLRRIFLDEAHQVLTAQDYRVCFRLLHRLVQLGVPITCLTATLMTRCTPVLLSTLKITDISIVDEIRSYTGRKNLKYHVEHIHESEHILGRFQNIVQSYSPDFSPNDRGIIYCRLVQDVEEVGKTLGCPIYVGRMDDYERKRAVARWKEARNEVDRWIACTEAFGQGVDYAHVRVTIHRDPWELINWVQETGRLGRDGHRAVSFTFWSDLPPALNAHDSDFCGRQEMRGLLRSNECIRLGFAALDREAHSCTALGAELCSRCEDTSNILLTFLELANLPVSVQTNAQQLRRQREAGESELLELKSILDSLANSPCPDCWVYGGEHPRPNAHDRHHAFNIQQNTLKLSWVVNDNWPFCWVCWVPFRRPCNHPPSTPGQVIKLENCPYQLLDSVTQKIVPIIPHLILLIFSHSARRSDSKEFQQRMADKLGVDCFQITQFDRMSPLPGRLQQ
ncbi:hypothetical protein D9757_014549 [Collybiopsis confluens]|uniref:DNA 3'-5' helicase n=1 Tax=Collybiopsis confluens TaxID=2823264 RepID=A0A8H5D1C6_9AGAR|nr:hypothetical protein D9757_014549 [Collybiopsis confluens]